MFEYTIDSAILEENTLRNKSMFDAVQKGAILQASKIDSFFYSSLKKHAPIAYWLMTKKIFRNRFVTKILRTSIIQRRNSDETGSILEFSVWNKEIGRVLIKDISFVVC